MALNKEKWTERGLRILRTDYEVLQQLAVQNDRSVDGEIRHAIQEHLRRAGHPSAGQGGEGYSARRQHSRG